MAEPGAFVPRPVAAFRVGISGARALTEDADQLKALRAQLDVVLGEVKAQVELHASSARAGGVYAPGAPLLRMLSPLAEGADRLAALAAADLGYELYAPLPFPQADYETDFPDTVNAFRTLLAKAGARVVELDGGRGEEETRSYEAVGRLVVRNCDLLIAIWDGGKGKGRGGTAELVRFAARLGVPIWWLRPDAGGQAAWIASPLHLRRPATCPRGDDATLKLKHLLCNAILPPLEPKHGKSARQSLPEFLAETQQSDHWFWTKYKKIYKTVMWLAAGRPAKPLPEPAPVPPAGAIWPYWDGLYAPVDQLAVDYANLYRSSYIMVFVTAALGLAAAAFGIGLHWEARFANILEIACLGVVFSIVFLNHRGRWHERFIAYRLLAELFRKQQALALPGWSLPATDASRVLGDHDDLPRDAWVGWYFHATVRAAPLPEGQLSGPVLEEIHAAILASLVAGQVKYHEHRKRDCEKAAQCFGRLGGWFFAATCVLVVLKLWLLSSRYNAFTDVVRPLLALLPSFSAAFVGIRGYAELELLADQSAQMRRLMLRTQVLLKNLSLTVPLASQDLGAETLVVSEEMALDIKGWSQLFRVKVVETG
jgi:hypothetical protein